MNTNGLELANFRTRCAAVILDWLLLSVLLTLSVVFSQHLGFLSGIREWALQDLQRFSYLVHGTIIIFVLYCWRQLQATPGKLLLGCRIVDTKTGEKPSLWQSFVRLFAYLLSALPLLLGFLWILWDKRKQGFHDKLAGTLVVSEDESLKSIQQLIQEMR